MPKLTYGQLKRVLVELGYSATPSGRSFEIYKHPQVRPVVKLPRGRDTETVFPPLWGGIRRMIYEVGIMDPEELDDRVFVARG